MYKVFLACFLFIILFASCKTKKEFHYLTNTYNSNEIEQMSTKLDKVYAMLLGHFSNKEQADTSKSNILAAQELINVPFWGKRTGEYWFYSGWFKDGFIENAIRQNIFQLSKKARELGGSLRHLRIPKTS